MKGKQMVTLADLHAISGVRSTSATTKAILDAFNRHAAAYGVTTQKRIALCLAHISIETGGFRHLDENMNYSAARLRQVWPSRFKTDAVAKQYAGNPRALANYVYGDRMGNKGRKDAGWLYRGSGPGQVTGYDNFLRAEKETGIPFVSQPDLMRDPDMGMKATLMLWQKWGMNTLADKDDVTASRKKWNGGTHGLAEVKAAWQRGMKRDLSVPTGTAAGEKNVSPSDSILKRGSKGPFVRELQENLNELGYSVKVDGAFGSSTESAVKAFQTKKGLSADGWAGPRTINAIGEAIAEKAAKPKIKEAAETVPESAEDEVKKETGLGAWIMGIFGGGGAGLSALLSANWETVLAVGGVTIVALVLLYIGRRRVIAAYKEINAEVRS